MKLVTFQIPHHTTYAGVIRGERVLPLQLSTLLELFQDPEGMTKAHHLLASSEQGMALSEVKLLTPLPHPPTMRDFYAFEQKHVASPAPKRNLGMIPEWL